MSWFFLGALFGGLAVLIAAHARRELATAVAAALATDDLPHDTADDTPRPHRNPETDR